MAENKRRRNITNAALMGAGGTTAGVSMLAGGVPGAKPDLSVANRLQEDVKGKGARRAAKQARNQAAAAKLTPGGILGFRTGIHEFGTGYLDEKARADKKAKRTSPDSSNRAYGRGFTTGQIGQEKKIIRGMKIGRKVSHGTLALGAATAGYGAGRAAKDKVKKNQTRDRNDRYHGTLAGVGAAGAGISHGTSKYLDSKYKGYAERSGKNIDRAGKLAPATAGREGETFNRSLRQMNKYKKKHPGAPWPKTMYPKVRDEQIEANPKQYLKGVDNKTAEKVGRLRGAAAEQRHYAEVFQNTAKTVRRFRTPSMVVGAAGVGGLAVNRDKKVKKSHNVSAFGVEH